MTSDLNLKTYPVTETFSVINQEKSFSYNDKESHFIDENWKTLLKTSHKSLFNGQIFCIDTFDSELLIGFYVEYKQFLAHRINPKLKKKYPLISLGVSGITFFKDHLLFGTRSNQVYSYNKYLELAPSGNVDDSCKQGDNILYRKQLLLELEQETTIASKYVTTLTPFTLLYDRQEEYYDICMLVILDDNCPISTEPNDEYDSLSLLSLKELPRFLESKKNNIIPPSLAVLKLSYIKDTIAKILLAYGD